MHCGAGVSRSASLVLAYMMRRFSWNAARARKHCQERRSLVNPNDGFWRSLCALEAQLGIADRCGRRAEKPPNPAYRKIVCPARWHTGAAHGCALENSGACALDDTSTVKMSSDKCLQSIVDGVPVAGNEDEGCCAQGGLAALHCPRSQAEGDVHNKDTY